MIKLVLGLGGLALLASCTATSDARGSRPAKGIVAHNTVVECMLYDGMTKDSKNFGTISSGNEVQVMDTVDAYFVKVRATVNGKTESGYMYRTCFAQ
ncbi:MULTISPECIES: SH3 domain-containing protein [Hymenobacter]|uniref:SH3 domain-containing protein n=1 Tax=Hymenobacter mucosus TaxID=1411120 RepID=A0A238X306_9BACT|nr:MULTISPECIES: SH3 domain-containing protein [Hymenobacter]SNR53375.1 hypothetical protein SAMN06269173_103443 [Hymenobacter mucosus]